VSLHLNVQRDGRLGIAYRPPIEKFRRFLYGAALIQFLFWIAMVALMGFPWWFAPIGLVLPSFLWLAFRLMGRKMRGIQFWIDPAARTLEGPDLDFHFGQAGYLVLDSYQIRRRNAGGDGPRLTRIHRLSFVEGEQGDDTQERVEEEIAQRPRTYPRREQPPLPADGAVLIPNGPYAFERAVARECGRAMGFSLLDMTTTPGRSISPPDQAQTLKALRRSHEVDAQPGAAPRGIRRREGPGEISLSFAANSLWIRILMLLMLGFMGVVLYVCGGLKPGPPLILVPFALLMPLASRWRITPEGIETLSTWFGITSSGNFISYEDVVRVRAEGRYLELVTNDETRRVATARPKVAQYLALSLLNPPEREPVETSAYR